MTHGFDAAGRLTSIGDWLGNTTVVTSNADSAVASTALPAGTDRLVTFWD